MVVLGEDIEWIANRVLTPSSLIAFVTGILIVVEVPFYEITTARSRAGARGRHADRAGQAH